MHEGEVVYLEHLFFFIRFASHCCVFFLQFLFAPRVGFSNLLPCHVPWRWEFLAVVGSWIESTFFFIAFPASSWSVSSCCWHTAGGSACVFVCAVIIVPGRGFFTTDAWKSNERFCQCVAAVLLPTVCCLTPLPPRVHALTCAARISGLFVVH